MDLGATLCSARAPKCLLCPLVATCAAAPVDPVDLRDRAARYAKPKSPQERIAFERTTRYVRGRIVDRLRALQPEAAISLLDLHAVLDAEAPHHDRAAVERVLAALVSDGIVEHGDIGVRLVQ